jgi:hypothetical protein
MHSYAQDEVLLLLPAWVGSCDEAAFHFNTLECLGCDRHFV